MATKYLILANISCLPFALASVLLYRQECFSGKQTTRKVHTKLHRGLEWRIFHILTSEDINDFISRSYTIVCAKILLSIL